MRPILSVRDLASRLGTTPDDLRAIAKEIADDNEAHYKAWTLFDPKKNKSRMLNVPRPALKNLQRRIKANILARIALREEAHGGVRGRSPQTNAKQHLAQPCVINIDVKKFYPHIRHYVVYRMFRRELGFGRDVARLLTRLTTFDSQVPQGSPTSTAIANLVLTLPLDKPVSLKSQREDVRYTRFVDDITLSGANPRPLINSVAKHLSRRRLPISMPKLKIAMRSQPQEVTGLIVNSANGPSVSRKRRDGIRAAIFQLRNVHDEAAMRKAVNSIRGRIAHVRQFNPGSARRMQKSLDAALDSRR